MDNSEYTVQLTDAEKKREAELCVCPHCHNAIEGLKGEWHIRAKDHVRYLHNLTYPGCDWNDGGTCICSECDKPWHTCPTHPKLISRQTVPDCKRCQKSREQTRSTSKKFSRINEREDDHENDATNDPDLFVDLPVWHIVMRSRAGNINNNNNNEQDLINSKEYEQAEVNKQFPCIRYSFVKIGKQKGMHLFIDYDLARRLTSCRIKFMNRFLQLDSETVHIDYHKDIHTPTQEMHIVPQVERRYDVWNYEQFSSSQCTCHNKQMSIDSVVDPFALPDQDDEQQQERLVVESEHKTTQATTVTLDKPTIVQPTNSSQRPTGLIGILQSFLPSCMQL